MSRVEAKAILILSGCFLALLRNRHGGEADAVSRNSYSTIAGSNTIFCADHKYRYLKNIQNGLGGVKSKAGRF